MNRNIECQSTIISELNHRGVKNPDHKSANAYDLAQTVFRQNLDIAINVLGPNHSLVRFIERKSLNKTRQYVDVTAYLLSDTLSRWGNAVGIGKNDHKTALVNLIDFDCNRFGYLSTIEAVVHTLASGKWEEDGKVKVPYQVVNRPGEKGVYVFEKGFAENALNFHSNGKSPTYKAYRDTRVPFLYIYAAPLGELEPHLGQVFDLISSLYHGQNINVNEKVKSMFTPLTLSEETRKELGRCGCLVLHPTKYQHVSQGMRKADEAGVFLVPIYEIPWIDEEGWPDDGFREWTLSQFEHETRHLADFRKYNGSPISASLLETRAFLKQIDFHQRNRQTIQVQTAREYLNPYLGILAGNQKATHVEEYYIKNINTALTKLSPRELELVANMLIKP